MEVEKFRVIMAPAFNDPALYPDEKVRFWLDRAAQMLPARVWGENLEAGILYYTAHQLVLNSPKRQNGAGQGTGLVASKSVGGASISYDNSTTALPGAGTFNLTTYGQQYWQLVQIVGMGVVQVSPNPVRGGQFYGSPRFPLIR